MVRTLEYCSVNWQVRTYTWFAIVVSGLWITSREYVVLSERLLLKLRCHVWTDRISDGEKPLMAYWRVLASGERLSRME
jgi:hypothetical protein